MEWVSLVPFGLLGLALGLYVLRFVRLGRDLEDLAGRLEGGTARRPRRWWLSRYQGLSVQGKLEGRSAVVTWDQASYAETRQDYLTFAVSVAHPACQFELTPADLVSRLGKWLGLKRADHPERFDVQTRAGMGGQALGALLTRDDVVELVDRLLDVHGCDRLSL